MSEYDLDARRVSLSSFVTKPLMDSKEEQAFEAVNRLWRLLKVPAAPGRESGCGWDDYVGTIEDAIRTVPERLRERLPTKAKGRRGRADSAANRT